MALNWTCSLYRRALAEAALTGELPSGGRVGRHVAGCDRCRVEWHQLRQLAGALEELAPAPVPADRLEQDVRARISRRSPVPHRSRLAPAFALAAALAVAGAAWLALRPSNQPGTQTVQHPWQTAPHVSQRDRNRSPHPGSDRPAPRVTQHSEPRKPHRLPPRVVRNGPNASEPRHDVAPGTVEATVPVKRPEPQSPQMLVKRGVDRLLVWVVDRHDGRPVVDVPVRARFGSAGELQGRTGADGICLMRAETKKQAAAIVTVSARLGSVWQNEEVDAAGPQPRSRHALWVDRREHSPGEPWRLRGALLDATGMPLAGAVVVADLTDAGGRVVLHRRLRTDASGVIDAPAALIAPDRVGAYTLSVDAAGSREQLDVAVRAPGTEPFRAALEGAGPDQTWTVRGWLGAAYPMEGARVTYAVHPLSEDAGPDWAAAFCLQDPNDQSLAFDTGRSLARGEGRLDSSGIYRFRVPAPEKPGPLLVQADVHDRQGRIVHVTGISGLATTSQKSAPATQPEPELQLAAAWNDGTASLAQLTVRSKLPAGVGLLTLEGDELYDARLVHLRPGVEEIPLPIRDRRVRDAVVTLLVPGADGKIHQVENRIRRPAGASLQVTLRRAAADPSQVAVRTTDSSGRPVAARLLPSLMGRLLPGRPLADCVWAPEYDCVQAAGRLAIGSSNPWLGELGTAAPAGRALEARPAEQALPSVSSGSDGTAVIRLPSSAAGLGGVLRVDAVGPGGAIGADDLELSEGQDLLVRLEAPARVCRGDVGLARAVLRNRSAFPRRVRVKWSGQGTELLGESTAGVELAPGAETTLDAPFHVSASGSLRVAATDGPLCTSDEVKVTADARTPSLPVLLITEGLPNGPIAPGEELGVTVRTAGALAPGRLRVLQRVPASFSVAGATAAPGWRLRMTDGGLLAEGTAARPGEEVLSLRLVARAPGSWSLPAAELLRDGRPTGRALSVRIAVAELMPPHLAAAEPVDAHTLRLVYDLEKRYAGSFRGNLSVAVRAADGRELGASLCPVAWASGSGSRARVETMLTIRDLEGMDRAVLSAELGGSGALDLGKMRLPLVHLSAVRKSRMDSTVGELEARVLGQSEWIPGAPVSVRVLALNSRDARPLPGTFMRLKFRPTSGGQAPVVLAEGTADAAGTLSSRAVLPASLRGPGQLIVECSSALGSRRIEQPVRIEERYQSLLTSDKPIYQPGQRIYLRGLVLRRPDLTPLGNTPATLQVIDPRGNRVMLQRARTNRFGVVSAELPLATELILGSYRAELSVAPEGGKAIRAEKSLEVKRYELPKFRIELGTDAPYYLPGDRIHGTLNASYFFGKPVAGGKVSLAFSTEAAGAREVGHLEGRTDADGRWEWDYSLPRTFVGQPGNGGHAALVVQAAVVDGAEHREMNRRSVVVAADPIDLAAVPEAGQIVPGVANRVYLLSSYPDGRPVPGATIDLGVTASPSVVQADARGFAQVLLRPGASASEWTAHVHDDAGRSATHTLRLRSRTESEPLLLRTDRAIYQAGQQARVDVFGTAAGFVYLDVLHMGQTVATHSLRLEGGYGTLYLPLDVGMSGTVELRVYRVTRSGDLVRDNRLIFVASANDLTVQAEPDRATYRPGERAAVHFHVTDRDGKPVQAALGVNIVDEAVFALQQDHPGLEQAYFTLERELLEPRYEVHWPAPGPELFFPALNSPGEDARQGLAQMVFAAATMSHDYPLSQTAGDTTDEVRKGARQALQGWADRLVANWKDPVWNERRREYLAHFNALPDEREGLGYYVRLTPGLSAADLLDPWGEPYRLRIERGDGTVASVTVTSAGPDGEFGTDDDLSAWTRAGDMDYLPRPQRQPGRETWWSEAETILAARGLQHRLPHGSDGRPITRYEFAVYLQRTLQQVQRDVARMQFRPWRPGMRGGWLQYPDWMSDPGVPRWVQIQVERWARVSPAFPPVPPGPVDPKFFSDVPFNGWPYDAVQQMAQRGILTGQPGERFQGERRLTWPEFVMTLQRMTQELQRQVAAIQLKPGPAGPVPEPPNFAPPTSGSSASGSAPRVRELFPETLYSNPSLITDEKGEATVDLTTADSITTWRVTAFANSLTGQLGSVTAPLRVFQPFFVDLDLPTALTEHDEVEIPVAVHNYLPGAQRVRVRLQLGDEDREAGTPWFELVGVEPAEKLVELRPNDVTAVRFRIRALRSGMHRLTVLADAGGGADAIRRSVEVRPDGREVETVTSGRLNRTTTATLTLPAEVTPETSRMVLRVYPGAFSQVVQGLEGMLRMPYGCFEQTTSTTYPNVMILQYLQRTGKADPAIRMKAEEYINLGYQRLLTFQHPEGGFSLFPSMQPETFLTAFGLMEMSDMSRVYSVDPQVIDRARAWLLDQQRPDGSWPVVGSAHQEAASLDGTAFTAYATWALASAAGDVPPRQSAALRRSVTYLHGKIAETGDPYVLALIAHALLAENRDSREGRQLLDRLADLATGDTESAGWGTPRATAFTGARGLAGSTETTALAALALLRHRAHPALAYRALTRLVRSKDAAGAWGTTQGTVLALQALLAPGPSEKSAGRGSVEVFVNGRRAAAITISNERAETVQQVDVTPFCGPGENRVELRVSGKLNAAYELAGRYYRPWSAEDHRVDPTQPLALDVTYDRTELGSDEELTARVRVRSRLKEWTGAVMLDLGIPPGFQADREALEALRVRGTIRRFDETGRQLLVYLDAMAPGGEVNFEYKLRSRFPIRAKTPPSKVYDYYTPDRNAIAAPVQIVVR